MENIFALSTDDLKFIANKLQIRIEEGLMKDGQEILAIPTHIHPKGHYPNQRVLSLDWGGTNFRAAIVEYKDGKATVLEDCKNRLSSIETKGFDQEKLHEKMAEFIASLKHLDKRVTKIGYCFSYPAASRLNGDAILLRWTKGIDIPGMINKAVGEPLLNYLNNHKDIPTTFDEIKVINDTVACLFAGLTELTDKQKPFDSYIGLIVGTGTNMAGLMPLSKIDKLKSKDPGVIPVNFESGNFNPTHLTVVDHLVDSISNNKGSQRFEKAISGGYLGEIFKTAFMFDKIKYDFDGYDLTQIICNPDKNKQEHVDAANWIYTRSARLVAASLAGLVQVLLEQDGTIKDIYLAADGSVFWSNDYEKQVRAVLNELLPAGVTLKISEKEKMTEPNLIGSAIAALS